MIRALLARRWWIVAGFALAAAVAAPGLLRLRIDNSAEGFFVRDAAALERFRDLELAFGRDRGVRIVVSGARLWSAEGLAWLAEIEDAVQRVHGVAGAAGPVRHHRWRFDAWPPADPRAFAAEVAADPVDRGAGWVSGAGPPASREVTVLAGLYRLAPAQRTDTLEEIEEILAGAPAGVEARVAGLPEINRALDRALVRMASRFFPALVVIAVLLLGLAYRSVSGVLLPLALVTVVETVVLGAMGWSGQRLDVVVILLVPLLFVITLATAVHVLTLFRRESDRAGRAEEAGAQAAVAATYRVKAWPVVWTGVTTAVGFGSLAVSPVPPIRALGLWSAFGISFMTLAMLALYPVLLWASGRGPAGTRPAEAGEGRGPGGGWGMAWAGRMGEEVARRSIRRRGVLYGAFGLVALAAAAGLPRLQIETAVLGYFRPEAPVRAGVEALEGRGLGSVAASVVLDLPAEGGTEPFDRPERLRGLEELAEDLRRELGRSTLGVVGAGDLVAGTASYLPEGAVSESTAASYRRGLERMRAEPALRRMLRYLMTEDGRTTRLTVLLPLADPAGGPPPGYRELEPALRRAAELAELRFPDARVWVTGQYPLVLAAQRSLLRTILVSLGATVLCVAAVFALLLRSPSLTLRALVPNLWPVLFVLGLMGWSGVAVDSATVMIAAVVLGLAVDDTLHTLGSFRRLGPRLGGTEGVAATLRETAAAHALTSLVLVAGFGAVSLSALLPVSNFGWLAADGIAAALVADLTLVPALLARAPAAAVARLGG